MCFSFSAWVNTRSNSDHASSVRVRLNSAMGFLLFALRQDSDPAAAVRFAEQLDARVDHLEPLVEGHAQGVAVCAAEDEDVAVTAQVAVHEDRHVAPVTQ